MVQNCSDCKKDEQTKWYRTAVIIKKMNKLNGTELQ